MNVSDFINTLETNPHKSLSFSFEEKFKVLPFIHITEIKNVAIESVDCGGKQNKWNETVMQLWTAAANDDGHRIDSSKSLSIINNVDKVSPLDKSSQILIEYGDVNYFVAQYDIELNTITNDSIYFELKGALSQCKGVSGNDQCCSSTSACCA